MANVLTEQHLHNLSPYGQTIMDEICDAVAGHGGYGLVGWTIGATSVVVDYVAARLGRSHRSVAGGLARLVHLGLLYTGPHQPWDDRRPGPLLSWCSLREEGWRHWSRWDEQDNDLRACGRDLFQGDPVFEWPLESLAEGAERFRQEYTGGGSQPSMYRNCS